MSTPKKNHYRNRRVAVSTELICCKNPAPPAPAACRVSGKAPEAAVAVKVKSLPLGSLMMDRSSPFLMDRPLSVGTTTIRRPRWERRHPRVTGSTPSGRHPRKEAEKGPLDRGGRGRKEVARSQTLPSCMEALDLKRSPVSRGAQND